MNKSILPCSITNAAGLQPRHPGAPIHSQTRHTAD